MRIIRIIVISIVAVGLSLGGWSGVSAEENGPQKHPSHHHHGKKERLSEMSHDKLLRFAEHLDITTEGKSDEELRKEIHEKMKAKWHDRLLKRAEELGIDTKGKSDKELHMEIRNKMKDKKSDDTKTPNARKDKKN